MQSKRENKKVGSLGILLLEGKKQLKRFILYLSGSSILLKKNQSLVLLHKIQFLIQLAYPS
jgi:hypothetical protein